MADAAVQFTINWLLENPFWGRLLAQVNKTERSDLRSIAWIPSDGWYALAFHPAFWHSKSKFSEKRAALIQHELLHLLFQHPFQGPTFSYKVWYDLACDLEVNQYIAADTLPENAWTLEQFSGLNLPGLQPATFYYKALIQAWKQKNIAPQLLAKILASNESLERHQYWHQINAKALASMAQSWEKLMKEFLTVSSLKVLDQQLQERLQAIATPASPVMDWRRMLQVFARSSRKTQLRNTIKRKSKRYGTVPGIKIQRRQQLMVVVDTSGSIDDAQLFKFHQEIDRIWREGAALEIVYCDEQIQAVEPYKGQKLNKRLGGGGTDFNPPLLLAQRKKPLDGLIYFTDGWGRVPVEESPCPILWLITTNGLDEQQPSWNEFPGKMVKMTL